MQDFTGKALTWSRGAAVRARKHPTATITLVAAVLALAAFTTWALWPTPHPTEAARARAYRDVDICMLTDSAGITGPIAAQAWQGMQDYSHDTTVRISYVPLVGPDTTQNADQYLAGLIQRRCRVIIVVGQREITAAGAAARANPDARFILLTNGQGAPTIDSPNVVTVNPADTQLRNKIRSSLPALAAL